MLIQNGIYYLNFNSRFSKWFGPINKNPVKIYYQNSVQILLKLCSLFTYKLSYKLTLIWVKIAQYFWPQ